MGTAPNIASLWATQADINVLRDDIARLADLIERVLVPAPRTWLTTAEAAALTGKSEQTIRTRCRVHKIGVMVHGAWQIDRDHLMSVSPRSGHSGKVKPFGTGK